MAVQPDPQLAGQLRHLPQLGARRGVQDGSGRHHHPAQRLGPGVVIAADQPFDIRHIAVEGFRTQRHRQILFHRPALGRPTPAQDDAHPQRFPFAEDNLRGIERHIRPVQVVVIRHAGAARAQKLHQANAHRQTKGMFIESRAKAVRRGAQPGRQALVQPLRLALQQRLKKMVVRVHPCRIDHAVAGIDLSLFRLRRQTADGRNLAVADANIRPGQPRRLPRQTAEDGMGIFNH